MGQFNLYRPAPFFFSLAPQASITNTDEDNSATNATSYAFASKSLGAAETGRIIAVVAATSGNPTGTVTGVDIGATAATQQVAHVSSANNRRVSIWSAQVDTGTTATITVTCLSAFRCLISVFSILGASGATASDTVTDNNNDPLTGLIDVPAGGVLLGGAVAMGSSTFSWTNATQDTLQTAETMSLGSASEAYASAQTGLSIEADQTVNTDPVLVAAAFSAS